MNSELKRRDFLQVISWGGLGFSMVPAPAVARQQQDRGLRAVASNESRNPYFEFSSDGMECIIRRPDTPVPWMNLLANDGFQTWITHQGFMECALLDRSVNGLTNPQEACGYIYVRDGDTGQFFIVNRPAAQAPWECRQGVGYTKITTAGLGIEAAITYFVPREGSILIWNLKL
jgi:cellobiose phosphorylase